MLNSKQRAMLRSMANEMAPIMQVGKSGIGEELILSVSNALEARELIKGTILQNCPLTTREAITELCEGANAEPVQCIGRRFVMYRESRKNKQIILD